MITTTLMSRIKDNIIIQDVLHNVGILATGELLKRFDTDGSPIRVGSVKMTSKGQITKPYQKLYGVCEVSRYVYPSSKEGATFCPFR